ncbi:MAG: transglutaminase domain-containing protein [Candidatus Omnitrophica bacterium]|nr:transglutaminase domain-containing protein [Candidatus Omnitrophota bacterium]
MKPAHRWVLSGVMGLGALAGAMGLVTSTTTTKQGVNYLVSSRPLPLYVKALDFLHRHSQYRLLANEITQGLATDRERALAVFEWTRRHIRPTPPDWVVVDDHVLHIIIRGHGLDDQMADVFTTLSTYAGVPAFWRFVKEPASRVELVLSFAKMDGRWAVFDVWRGLIFRNSQGEFCTPEELAADPALVSQTVGSLNPGSASYVTYVSSLAPFTAPEPLRAELQMPWPRLVYAVRERWRNSWR